MTYSKSRIMPMVFLPCFHKTVSHLCYTGKVILRIYRLFCSMCDIFVALYSPDEPFSILMNASGAILSLQLIDVLFTACCSPVVWRAWFIYLHQPIVLVCWVICGQNVHFIPFLWLFPKRKKSDTKLSIQLWIILIALIPNSTEIFYI